MAVNPLIVVSPHLLLYATIQMVHSQSTFAWLILQCGCQHGCSAGETHYTVCPLCVCAWYLFSLKSLCTNMLSITEQYVTYCGQVFRWRICTLKSITEIFRGGLSANTSRKTKNTPRHKHFKILYNRLKRKPKYMIWSVDLVLFFEPKLLVDCNFYLQLKCKEWEILKQIFQAIVEKSRQCEPLFVLLWSIILPIYANPFLFTFKALGKQPETILLLFLFPSTCTVANHISKRLSSPVSKNLWYSHTKLAFWLYD